MTKISIAVQNVLLQIITVIVSEKKKREKRK